MLFRINANRKCQVQQAPIATMAAANHHTGAAEEAELRRLMYERIAQGNALAEAEDYARDQWRSR